MTRAEKAAPPARASILAIGAIAVLSACESPVPVRSPDAVCSALAGSTISSGASSLPTAGATISAATLMAPATQAVNANGGFTPATPEYCKVLVAIASVDPQAPPINFQLNLPTQWNRNALQVGGGGYNGVLVTGMDPLPSAPPDAPLPISRGYATFGTDSGHQMAPGVEVQAFALNDEALTNFAYAAYKKTRDFAIEIIARRYGAPPSRIYYAGSSEGGREGLAMAQRFPADYDGIISRVPVINWVGLQTAGNRSGVVLSRGGWLSPAKVELVHKAVLAACDAQDGLADGIISRYEGCAASFNSASLRCPNGADAGAGCLSDAQITAIDTLHSPQPFPFALANGVTRYPGWGYGGEAHAGGWALWWSGKAAAKLPADADHGLQFRFGSGAVRYFFARDPKLDPLAFTPGAHAARMQQVSELMDATSPDLAPFAGHGGRLILHEHTGDYAQSPFAGIEYFKSVQASLGAARVDEFARLYVTPGADHRGINVPGNIDMLAILAAWVEQGRPPPEPLIQTAQNPTPPFAVVSSRPLCRYPTYPRYSGGDPNSAGSFSCAAP
jgi:Tannase and feruloyl esterase